MNRKIFIKRTVLFVIIIVVVLVAVILLIGRPRSRDAKPGEIELYHQYLPQIEAETGKYIDEIVSHCVYVKTNEETGTDVYASYDLEDYLYGCRYIYHLGLNENNFEIIYVTIAEWEVRLYCNENGVDAMSVYNPKENTFFYENETECSIYKNFK